MIEVLRKELKSLENDILYIEETDAAWHPTYTKLCKMRKILKTAIRKLEKLEGRKNVSER